MELNLFETANAGFAQIMYEEFLRDPASVSEEWRRFFENGVSGLQPDAAGNIHVIYLKNADAHSANLKQFAHVIGL